MKQDSLKSSTLELHTYAIDCNNMLLTYGAPGISDEVLSHVVGNGQCVDKWTCPVSLN